MQMWSSRYLEDPLFLKASDCVDIHATGALAQFAVIKTKTQPSVSESMDGMEIYNVTKATFTPLINVYMELYAHVESVYDDEATTTDKQAVSDYIMTAAEYNDLCRQDIKAHKECHFILLSMTICSGNIQKATAGIRGDRRSQRTVKMMKRQFKKDGLTFTSFMRIKVKCADRNTDGNIDGEVALLQVEDGAGNFILITESDAMLGMDGQISKSKVSKENSKKAHGAFQAAKSIQDIATIIGIHKDENSNDPQLPVKTGPVIVLKAKEAPVELMTRLSEDTRQKIYDSKDVNPTQIYPASSLIGCQGSPFKHAQSVSIGFMETPSRVLSRVFKPKLSTFLLEHRH